MDQRFLTLSQLTHLPAPKWQIEGLFEVNTLTMLAGPSYSFKSFLLLDWLLNIASGRNWNGRKTLPAKVVYSLGEGKSSLLKRVIAWITYNKITPEEEALINANFRITFDVPQLALKSSLDKLLFDLDSENFKPDIIAVDTFARSMVGLDENDAKDTGMWIENADRLRQLGYGVIFLHHTKKNTEFGVQYRGSSAIIGAMDTAMTLVRENNYCTLTVTKQKDHDEGAPMRFRRHIVGSGDSESCVLVPAPILDERFSEEAINDLNVNDIIDELLEDANYVNDAARATELSNRTGMQIGTAQTRISRRKKVRDVRQ